MGGVGVGGGGLHSALYLQFTVQSIKSAALTAITAGKW